MKINRKILAISAGAVLAALIPLLVFHARAPVLIVTEQSFIGLYGKDRIRDEASRSSFALFRPVKTVAVANDSSDDIVPFAIAEVSSKPFCVIFPLRFARPARLYHEQNPEIPVVLLEGRFPDNSTPSEFAIGSGGSDGYFIYKTDINADFFRAGVAAAALDEGKNGSIVVFLDSRIQRQAREAFMEAINELENPLEARFFTSFSQFYDISDISCVVAAGSGAEYLEKKAGVPVILFSWLNPSLIPSDVVLVVNDSPWAQVLGAVKMVKSGEKQGRIRSKFELQKNKKFDRGTLRKLHKMV